MCFLKTKNVDSVSNAKVYFVMDLHPLSINSKGKSTTYKSNVLTYYLNSLYSSKPFFPNESLRTDIVYFNREQNKGNILDVDNISKPLVDSFIGTIYTDDSQVVYRTAMRYDLEELEIVTLNATNLPSNIIAKFQRYMNSSSKDITLMRVSKFNKDDLEELLSEY